MAVRPFLFSAVLLVSCLTPFNQLVLIPTLVCVNAVPTTETKKSAIVDKFNELSQRDDVGILLINQNVRFAK